MNALEEFKKRFSEEVIEIIILTQESVGGAAVFGHMLRPSLNFIASVNVRSGELSHEKGRLEWMIEKDPKRTGWGYDFKQFGIYHIKARKNLPIELKPNMLKTINNTYMVVEIIEENTSEPRLEKIKEQISKPVIIEDEKLGKFVLDRKFSWFEGDVDWLGDKCSVSLETDEEDGDTAEKALCTLKELYKDLKSWDNKFRTYAADNLTDLANDWLEEDDDSDHDTTAITKENFADRIQISEVSITPKGDITLYYNDDDMFWGHAVEIDANINGDISDTNIVG